MQARSILSTTATGGYVIPLVGRHKGDHVRRSRWLWALNNGSQSIRLISKAVVVTGFACDIWN